MKITVLNSEPLVFGYNEAYSKALNCRPMIMKAYSEASKLFVNSQDD